MAEESVKNLVGKTLFIITRPKSVLPAQADSMLTQSQTNVYLALRTVLFAELVMEY
jgi:hypothetical protein